MRVLSRATRRAKLPVAMSEGFNPRQKISLVLARGVGVASTSEFAEIDLDGWMSVGDVRDRLNAALPEGLSAERAVLGNPKTHRRAVGIAYRVDARTTLSVSDADARALLERTEVWIERVRRKSGARDRVRRIDIRPFIEDVSVTGRTVAMSLKVSDAGTTRVEEVYAALGGDADTLLRDARITRTGMTLSPPI